MEKTLFDEAVAQNNPSIFSIRSPRDKLVKAYSPVFGKRRKEALWMEMMIGGTTVGGVLYGPLAFINHAYESCANLSPFGEGGVSFQEDPKNYTREGVWKKTSTTKSLQVGEQLVFN